MTNQAGGHRSSYELDGHLQWLADHSPVRVEFAAGVLDSLGARAREVGAKHALLVTDNGIRDATDYEDRANASLVSAGLAVTIFDGAEENPTTTHVTRGVEAAHAGERTHGAIDLIVGLGGGSAMDCAKGINFLLTNGSAIRDYWGDADEVTLAARKPLISSILVPTTAGTGSEAQSFALISDADTHVKMACGDRRPPGNGGLRPVAALLDPALTKTVPRAVMVATTLDAITHAIETSASKRANESSRAASQAAWQLLTRGAVRVLADTGDDEARADMLLGAHLAGVAIEQSMLGAAHACANPLTATYGTTHGIAVGVMMPHVIRHNAATGENPYATLGAAREIADVVSQLLAVAGISPSLRDHGIDEAKIPALAEAAAKQWTAQFNPRAVDAAALEAIYRDAF